MKRASTKTYTVNTRGNNVALAELYGYHAYYASGVTAIEIPAVSPEDARAIVNVRLDLHVYYVFL